MTGAIKMELWVFLLIDEENDLYKIMGKRGDIVSGLTAYQAKEIVESHNRQIREAQEIINQ